MESLDLVKCDLCGKSNNKDEMELVIQEDKIVSVKCFTGKESCEKVQYAIKRMRYSEYLKNR